MSVSLLLLFVFSVFFVILFAKLLPPDKKLKSKILREEILSSRCVGVKTLYRNDMNKLLCNLQAINL